jgi:hypothetical protein
MCTPQRLRENCSCPHQRALGVIFAVKCAAALVFVAGVGAAIGAGYGAWLLLVAWLMVMGVAALVSRSRDVRAAQASDGDVHALTASHAPAIQAAAKASRMSGTGRRGSMKEAVRER